MAALSSPAAFLKVLLWMVICVASLVQLSTSNAVACKMNFSKLDYSSITSECKAPEYDHHKCCAAFNKLACNYGAAVNDFSSTCPIEFISFLNMAGPYPHGVFVNRCLTDNKLCSTST
ncbi:hypothetical protein O6H91_08G111500 [Diphasiastrum complanatum]|uniref:Uncharacterized protein n=1 Tax=Diphasiastrum complanatum TaxID=34168 RepID=A0ACC2D0Y9_DIPCM|nr:hypothetical protein O6H91_08G111500 [Diphasiastrum complanatum]